MMRTCKHCEVTRPVAEFHGRRTKCKECVNAALRKRYAEDEEFRAYKLKHGAVWRGSVAGPRECSHCRETQPSEQFYGPRKMCKKCFAAWGREKRSLLSTKRANKNSALLKSFGIGLETYERMVADAGGVCEICKLPESREGFGLSVDHCHTSGKVRGVLCSNCNRALGQLKESPSNLRAALAYLERFL